MNEKLMDDAEDRKRLLERVMKSNRNALYIGRVPPEYKQAFKDISDERFLGDMGMYLVHLMDIEHGIEQVKADFQQQIDLVLNMVEQLQSEISSTLSAKKDEDKSDRRVIKLANGSMITAPKRD